MNAINRRDFLRQFGGQATVPSYADLPKPTPYGMRRRDFLAILTSATIASVCDPLVASFDPERLLWVPTDKLVVLAPPQVVTWSGDLASRFAAILGQMLVNEPVYAQKVRFGTYAPTGFGRRSVRPGTYIPLDATDDQVEREHLIPLAGTIAHNLGRGHLYAFNRLYDLDTVANPPAYAVAAMHQATTAIDPVTRVAVRVTRGFNVTENQFSSHFELLGRQTRAGFRDAEARVRV